MWPFSSSANPLWLVLYVVTFAIHIVLVGYVVAGTAYALIQSVRGKHDAIAEGVRDRLPFMLGLGITAGVAPLLFLQLLYQWRFYSANLILGPRWGAVVPALVVGFYALYLAKASIVARTRKLALATGLLCFVFVAWSWTEIHALMHDESAWRVMYAAGDRVYTHATIVPRLVMWLGAMTTGFATLAAWWARPEELRRLAVIGTVGRIVSVAAITGAMTWLDLEVDARGWGVVLAAAVAVELAGWMWLSRRPDGAGLSLVTAAGSAALVAGVIVREAPRLELVNPERHTALDASGVWVFAVTAVAGVVMIGWIVRTIRRAR